MRHYCKNSQLASFPDSSVGKESTCNAGDPSLIPGSGRPAGEGIDYPLQYSWTSLVTQLVKNPPAMWETWVQNLGWEDPLEKGKAAHSSMLAWRTPWSPWGHRESDAAERLHSASLQLTDDLLNLSPAFFQGLALYVVIYPFSCSKTKGWQLVHRGSDSNCSPLRGPTPWSLRHTLSLPSSLPSFPGTFYRRASS